MHGVYDVLEKGSVGIFESPTGTGKSLSIICGCMRWLEDHLDEAPEGNNGGDDAGEELAWINEAAMEMRRSQHEHLRDERLKRRTEALARAALADAATGGRDNGPREAVNVPVDDTFLLKDVAGDLEGESLGVGGDETVVCADDDLPYDGVQIIYCSRTHSQLSQFIQEVRRTPYAARVSTVTLASRKQLCVHEPVARLANATRMNDACRELHANKSAGCPFSAGSRAQQGARLKDKLLTSPTDLEDLVSLGKERGCCPYFTARSAANGAQVLAVPYSCLLHEPTREALGIRLSGSVVICDEAHNLVDAVNDAHSMVVTHAQAAMANGQLGRYFVHYERRLSTANRTCVKQLMRFTAALEGALSQLGAAGGQPAAKVVGCNDFLCGLGVDHLNLFNLLAFCRRSEITKKVQGFVDYEEAAAATSVVETRKMTPSAMYAVIALLGALTADGADGRIVTTSALRGGCSSVKYLHLNPLVHFAPIVQAARSVLLAGGTMEPISEVMRSLFAGLPTEKVVVKRLGHVVPPGNLFGACVSRTLPGGKPLVLTAERRVQFEALDAVADSICGVRSAAPGGLIVFVPSFAYLADAVARWTVTGALARLIGKVFMEAREGAGDSLLEAYRAAVVEEGRATLIAVVGAKLSEGINFADDFGRTVIVVGMPYPNPKDPELVERMAFITQRERKRKLQEGGVFSPGQQYYEALCMRAVNQAIGRVIRHAADYACIVLLDHRYTNQRVRDQIPEWIRGSLRSFGSMRDACGAIAAFFEGKRREV